MSRQLNYRYFSLLLDSTDEYELYLSKYPGATFILESPSHPYEPIAALSLTSENLQTNQDQHYTPEERKLLNRALMTQRSQDHCQGLVNNENNTIGFVITNLTNHGFIKIDILPEDINVQDVNLPTQSINQVNELASNQSYHVISDQRCGNYKMKLSGLIDSKSGKQMTVQDSESQNVKTTNFYINVLANSNFPDILTDAVWRPADLFVRKVPKTTRTYSISNGDHYEEESSNESGIILCSGSSRGYELQSYSTGTAGTQSKSVRCARFAKSASYSRAAGAPSQDHAQKAQAANVVTTSDRVQVNSSETDIIYNFEKQVPKLRLS